MSPSFFSLLLNPFLNFCQQHKIPLSVVILFIGGCVAFNIVNMKLDNQNVTISNIEHILIREQEKQNAIQEQENQDHAAIMQLQDILLRKTI